MITPFFVVGCPRSGTTLLQRILDAHPEVAVSPETHFMRRIWTQRWRYVLDSEGACRERLLSDLQRLPEIAEMGLDVEDYRRRLKPGRFSFERGFRLLLEQFGERTGASRVGEKTPNHLIYIPRLRRFFPGARFIQIIRDPRAVVASLRRVPWSTGFVAGEAVVWRRYARLGLRLRQDPDIASVRYEALVRDPEPIVRDLCGFLDLEFEPSMMDFHQHKTEGLNIEREPWKWRAQKPLTTDRLESWREELEDSEIGLVESLVSGEMERWGFEPSGAAARRPRLIERPAMLRLMVRHIGEHRLV